MWRSLRADPLWPRTLILVPADHGGSFGGRAPGHATGVSEESVARVPLLVRYAGQRGRLDR